MSSLTRCILLVVLLLGSSFFSMTESAFSYCNQIKLRISADEGSKSSKLVLKCLENFDKYIIVNLIGNNIVNTLLSILSTTLCVTLLTDFSSLSIEQINAASVIISTIVATIVVFFIGEIITKNIGKTFPNFICKIVVYPILALDVLFTPVSLIYRGFLWVVKKIFKTKDDAPILDEEDFQDIVEAVEEQGLIEEQEKAIIQSAVEFDDMKVKQVMCKRENICALNIDKDMNKDELIDYILDNPYTRIPVYKDNIDNILGVLHTQKLLKAIMTKQNYSIEKLLVEPIFVRPNVHLDTLFEEFKKKRTHIAVVQDKELKTLGIVTMEDVLEELVGDIDESNEGGDSNE